MQLSKLGSSQMTAVCEPEELLNVAEAAKYIGRCRRTVQNYVNAGLLKGVKGRGRSTKFRKPDLQAFLEVQNQGVNPRDAREFMRVLMWKMGMLEKRLDFLMRVNDLDVSALRDAPIETLLSAHEQATQTLDNGDTNPPREVMEQWAHVFLQFTECEYGRLADAAVDAHPWKPFSLLCHILMGNLRKKFRFQSSVQQQQTYRLLEKARKNIAQSALAFEELFSARQGAPRVAELSILGLRIDSLDRFIAAEVAKGR